MVELITKKELYRVKLIESTLRRPILEGKEFKSAYAKGSLPKFFITKNWKVLLEKPEFNYRLVKEFSECFPKGWDIAYTMSNNDYIGRPEDAKYFCEKRGLSLEKSDPKHCCCSIGKCVFLPENHKDFGKFGGYSHRAIYLFGYDYVVKAGDCVEGYFPVGFKPKTEEDLKALAIAFADSVS